MDILKGCPEGGQLESIYFKWTAKLNKCLMTLFEGCGKVPYWIGKILQDDVILKHGVSGLE